MDNTSGAQASDDLIPLAQAFDLAWRQFTAAEGSQTETDDNRRRLASQLVALSRAGEHDIDALAQAALTHLRAYAAAIRIGQQTKPFHPTPAGEAFDAPGASFGPDAVEAMRNALDLCLDDLPLRLPSGVRETLSSEIMRSAAHGERDAERLRDAALAALEKRK